VYWHYKQWREAGVIETLMELLHGEVRQIDYFKAKPVNIPKITIVLGHGYHIETLITALEKVYPQIMTKIRFQLCKKPSKEEKAAQGKWICASCSTMGHRAFQCLDGAVQNFSEEL
jgi:ribosomal protein L37AE/L43A